VAGIARGASNNRPRCTGLDPPPARKARRGAAMKTTPDPARTGTPAAGQVIIPLRSHVDHSICHTRIAFPEIPGPAPARRRPLQRPRTPGACQTPAAFDMLYWHILDWNVIRLDALNGVISVAQAVRMVCTAAAAPRRPSGALMLLKAAGRKKR